MFRRATKEAKAKAAVASAAEAAEAAEAADGADGAAATTASAAAAAAAASAPLDSVDVLFDCAVADVFQMPEERWPSLQSFSDVSISSRTSSGRKVRAWRIRGFERG